MTSKLKSFASRLLLWNANEALDNDILNGRFREKSWNGRDF